MRIEILGVPIDVVTRTEARLKAEKLLQDGHGHLITTPNPEMLVLAAKVPEFKAALRQADLAIPDGVGLLVVARMNGTRFPERVTGSDFMLDIAELAANKKASLYLLGGEKPEVWNEAAAELRRRFPDIRVVGAESGGTVRRNADGTWQTDAGTLERIRAANPDILFVAFGHGKQEMWIVDHLKDLPSIRLAMGIGGAFDFLAGRVKRAPMFMQNAGLEWLWRLMREPRRIGRIWTAVIVFPWLALRRKN
jgi:N-acetylglucosaminyldiphosphoundecaprenol N-acetyl-beta-D-mannosaminyltransferase